MANKDRGLFLQELQDKAERGDTLSDEDIAILNKAEEDGTIEESGFFDRVGRQFTGETGKENLVGASSLGVEVGGATAGLLAGGALPLPLPLRPIAALAGAGVGAMGGNVLAQLGIQGKEELDVGETVLSGGLEVIFPGITKLIQKGGKKGVELIKSLSGSEKKGTPFKSSLTEDLARETQKAGVSVPLAAVFEGKLLGTLDGIASKSLTGSKIMSKQNQSAQEFLESRIEDFSRKFSQEGSPLQIAKQTQQAIKGDVQTFRDLRGKIFGRLDIAGFQKEGAKVDLTVLGKGTVTFKEAASILEKSTNSRNINRIKGEMMKTARRLDSKPIGGNFEGVQSKFPENSALAEELQEIASRDALQSSATFVDDLKIALDLTEEMGQRFNQTLLKDLAETRPEAFLEELFKTGKPDTIRAIFKMKDLDGNPLLNDEVKNSLRAVFLGAKGKGTGLFARSTELVDGVSRINGKKLLTEINNFEGKIGTGVSMALFPGTGLEGVKRYAKFLDVLQSRRGEGAGTMAMFLQTPGAVETLATAGVGVAAGVLAGTGEIGGATVLGTVGAGTIIFGPKALAKMLTSKSSFDRFAKGFEKRMKRPDDLAFYLSTIAAQLAKGGDNVRYVGKEESQELLDEQTQERVRETKLGMLQRLVDGPL